MSSWQQQEHQGQKDRKRGEADTPFRLYVHTDRGWKAGGRHVRDYRQDCARHARFLALERAMCKAVAGVRQRLTMSASRGILAEVISSSHAALSAQAAVRSGHRPCAFHDPVIGTGFDVGGG